MYTKKQKIWHAIIFLLIIVVCMSTVNYYVDSYAQVRISYEDIAEQMLEGNSVTRLGESRTNERYLTIAVIQGMTEAPEQIILGSSRSMVYGKETFEADTFYNFSLSGGSLYDYYGVIGYLENENLLPEKVLIEIGGPLFYEVDYEKRYTYLQEGIDYLKEVMEGKDAKLKAPNVGKQYRKLLAIDYFKYNLQCLWENSRFDVGYVKDASGENAKLPDGSFVYSTDAEAVTVDEIIQDTEAVIAAKNVYKVEGYTQMSAELVADFENLVEWLMEQGIEVELFLPPYSEMLYQYMQENMSAYQGIFDAEEYIVNFSKENGLNLYGSYSPAECGLDWSDLMDCYHMRRQSGEKALYLR